MFREKRGARQSAAQFATKLIEWYAKIADKFSEQLGADEVQVRMHFLSGVLKVQLAAEVGKQVSPDKDFLEAAREIMDAGGREEEKHGTSREEEDWVRIEPRRTRASPGGRQERTSRWRPGRAGGEGASRRRREVAGDRKCFECGRQGHLSFRCPVRKCFDCGTEGHIARECPYTKRRGVNKGEPMEVNVQRLRYRRRQSSGESGTTETESSGEEEEKKGKKSSRLGYRSDEGELNAPGTSGGRVWHNRAL